jgi:hypothetical protein
VSFDDVTGVAIRRGETDRTPGVLARRDVAAALIGLVLVVAAFVLPRLNLGVLPLVDASREKYAELAGSAPIHGAWELHVGAGSLPAAVLGLCVVLRGPSVAQRMRWRAVVLATWATACAWAFALAMVDGWQRGFAGRLTTRHEYVRQVPTIDDVGGAVRGFTARILDFQPDSWITHVSGHPPGALLTFVWLDRLGLTGGAWAGLLCLLVGSSAAAAVVVAVRSLADETTARSAAPFVAVAPTAIWVAVSADGYFAGVTAWALALLAVAVRGGATRRSGGCGRVPAGMGVVSQLRPGPDGAARAGDADRRDASRSRATRPGGCDARGSRRRGDLPVGRLLVVRRIPVGAGQVLAGDRQSPTIPVLGVGQSGIGGLCGRIGRCRRGRSSG